MMLKVVYQTIKKNQYERKTAELETLFQFTAGSRAMRLRRLENVKIFW
jgi:hypothetical protein